MPGFYDWIGNMRSGMKSNRWISGFDQFKGLGQWEGPQRASTSRNRMQNFNRLGYNVTGKSGYFNPAMGSVGGFTPLSQLGDWTPPGVSFGGGKRKSITPGFGYPRGGSTGSGFRTKGDGPGFAMGGFSINPNAIDEEGNLNVTKKKSFLTPAFEALFGEKTEAPSPTYMTDSSQGGQGFGQVGAQMPAAGERHQDILGEVPGQLLGQHQAIAERGIYGEPGMASIMAPRLEAADRLLEAIPGRLSDETSMYRSSAADARRRATKGLTSALGSTGAVAPGVMGQIVQQNIGGPMGAAEQQGMAAMRRDAYSQADQIIAQLGEEKARLLTENMLSKQSGLAGMQDMTRDIGTLQKGQWWDTQSPQDLQWAMMQRAQSQTLEKMAKQFGYSMQEMTERIRLNTLSQRELMALQHQFDMELAEFNEPSTFEKFMKALSGGAEAYKDYQTGRG